ncbi:SPARC-like protein 1 [Hyla sarda]|uniref:SPARC-like protein 1 n=1 Tax=Hyla sarda TaxID=327740 RepID=UPI0024C3EDB0|nr:SPARC-like protein 1 [Hyla sarda]
MNHHDSLNWMEKKKECARLRPEKMSADVTVCQSLKRCTKMYYFGTVACLIGIYFTSSDSLTVERELMPGVKLNESMKEQRHKENVIDQYAITDVDSDIESTIQSKHKMASGRQEEDSKAKPGTFSIESFLNLFSVDIGNNGQSPLDSKENQTNISKYKNEGDSVIDKVDSKMQKENKSNNEEHESNDQQSHGLSTGGLSEQSENFPLKTNTDNVQFGVEGSTGYAHFLEETHDANVLNILNITHNLDTMKQRINNDTHNNLYVKEPSSGDASVIKDLESVRNIKEEDILHIDSNVSRDDIEVKKEIMQNESAIEEQQRQHSDSTGYYNRIRVDNISELTATDQHDGNTDKPSSVLLENPSELLVSHHDHGVDGAIQKNGEGLEINNKNLSVDPCIHFHCKRGKMCKTDGHGNPFCVCQDPDLCLSGNRNDLVCGTDNKTYPSACHLFGTKCFLEGSKERNHLHLDYQGPCKYIPPCTEYELAHFPFRMRDWLKNVLMQLYERDQENTGLLSEKQKSKMRKIYENEKRLQEGDHNIELLVKDFQKNYNMYIYPVHWQFHQLDQHSMDRLLTHSELAALRAPLIPIEHCVNKFLQECNTNNDRHISLWEWCCCFGIKEDDIDEDLLF